MAAFVYFRKDIFILMKAIFNYKNAPAEHTKLLRYLFFSSIVTGICGFLLAFMLYNDGIQTVLSVANLYGADELGLGYGALLGTLLMIQFVAIGGALFFSWLAGRIGTKQSVMLTLIIWSVAVSYAWPWSHSPFACGVGNQSIATGRLGHQLAPKTFTGSR